MVIPRKVWESYVKSLYKISNKAGGLMQGWLSVHGYEDFDAMVEYAHALVTRYGEASASLACEMYDATAAAQGASVATAVPAETATYGNVRYNLERALEKSQTLVSGAVSKMVKQAGADTTLHNAARDRAEWAWIPHGGETCAYCITLASRGWQKADASMQNYHAEHIHEHCQCEFAVRFNSRSDVAGYNGGKDYYDQYRAAGGYGADRINALRRALYEENKEQINAQKRAAYAARKEQETEEQ